MKNIEKLFTNVGVAVFRRFNGVNRKIFESIETFRTK